MEISPPLSVPGTTQFSTIRKCVNAPMLVKKPLVPTTGFALLKFGIGDTVAGDVMYRRLAVQSDVVVRPVLCSIKVQVEPFIEP